ncbi:hypothetical protein FA95DRAFT_317030 [Auriscalpium vulgare]|uniref:Uncharacterized protein n=1 Tax=Auriscalpium vulgare TaxID=40419 RepID=A0ACB8S4Q3_9AGAM|nr:hypothetical protein FA95DRAFT_317030 [Auriscalpium vulgare]
MLRALLSLFKANANLSLDQQPWTHLLYAKRLFRQGWPLTDHKAERCQAECFRDCCALHDLIRRKPAGACPSSIRSLVLRLVLSYEPALATIAHVACLGASCSELFTMFG